MLLKYKENITGSTISWFRTGGIIKAYFEISSIEQAQLFMQQYGQQQFFIFGAMTNTLLSDNGCNIAIKMKMNQIQILDNSNQLYVESGVPTTQLIRFCIQHQLGGLEFTSTIPGTIGGLLFMNAGAYGGQMQDVVHSVNILTPNGNIMTLLNHELQYQYRHSNIPPGHIIISAILNTQPSSSNTIQQICAQMQAKRQATQPLQVKSLGSTFTNPTNHTAGKLIEQVGLKGTIIGGARISPMHGNFIENFNNATSSDFMQLTVLMQQKVFDTFGIMLSREIKYIED